MTDDGSLPIVLVGAGRIAAAYADALRGHPRAHLAGVVDADAAPRTGFEPDSEILRFADIAELADLDPRAAAVVCTPPNTHKAIIAALLRARRPVLSEKPLTTRPTDTAGLCELAASLGVPLALASKFRFSRDVNRLREFLSSGEYGRPISYECSFAGVVDMSGRWNSRREISGGGVVMDNGVHALDLARYLFGPVAGVTAFAADFINAVESSAGISVSNGETSGFIDLSWCHDKAYAIYLAVETDQATLRIGWRTAQVRRHSETDWVDFGKGYDKRESFVGILDDFLAHVNDGGMPRTPPGEMLEIAEVTGQAYVGIATQVSGQSRA